MKSITIHVPDVTQLLHLLAVIDRGMEIHYETKFFDLRTEGTDYKLPSCYEEREEGE